MKKLLLFVLLITGVIVSAQNFKCGQQIAYEYLFSKDKTAKQRLEQLIESANKQSNNSAQLKSTSLSYTIPVVFHVLHLGGAENISDAQIHDAVAILNRDFKKKNADTINIVPQFTAVAANCDINFALATLDENGFCTNGITRHYTQNTNWTINGANYLYTWDRTKYLNIYLVKTMQSGIAGYTYLPGTAGANEDAVVILHDYVGSIGTSNPYTSRALTHEVGHWFNLQHVWGSTNQPGVACGDDGVGDTPITQGHYSCNLGSTDCNSGIVENVQNYMEYAYCSNMYTQDQKTRMQNCIISGVAGRNNLSSNANLIATGVINSIVNCGPTAEFIFNSNTITCLGNSLAFTDYSYNGTPTSWLWSSPMAANTSTAQNGTLNFTSSGLTSVKLKVSNAFGNDSIIKQNYVVLAGANSGTINVNQGFENSFPDNNWIASIPQYGSSFTTNTTTAATGTNCVWVNNFFDNPNGPVTIYSPRFNFQSGVNAPQLSFKYAYTQQATSNNDVLKVFVSTNCGSSWLQVYSKSGNQLNTIGTLNQTAYLAPQPTDWVTEMINLSFYQGNPQISFKIEFTPDPASPGNNIFLDDINIVTNVSVKENNSFLNNVSVYPNPTDGLLNLKFEIVNQENTTVQLVNTLGQILINKQVDKNLSLNISGFEPGIYFLKVNSAKENKIIKVIKE